MRKYAILILALFIACSGQEKKEEKAAITAARVCVPG